MQIAFRETKYDIQAMLDEYVLLECVRRKTMRNEGVYLLEIPDGNGALSIFASESNSGIEFGLFENHIEIYRVHVTDSRRGTKLSEKLLAPLIKYGKENNILKFRLTATNRSFWNRVQQRHSEIEWDFGGIDMRSTLEYLEENFWDIWRAIQP